MSVEKQISDSPLSGEVLRVANRCFVTDFFHLMYKYEKSINLIDHTRLPLSLQKILQHRHKTETVAFRGSSALFFKDAAMKLGFETQPPSPNSLAIGNIIDVMLAHHTSPGFLISTLVSIEENMSITRNLLKQRIVENLKASGEHSHYRNSSLKIYFDLWSNVTFLMELSEIEDDLGVETSNERVIELTELFFDWWKTHFSSETIEANIL